MTNELLRSLGQISETEARSTHATLAEILQLGTLPGVEEHTDLFSFELPPYASVYLSPSGSMGGPPVELISGFFRALSQPVPDDPDHLATLLGVVARLGDQIEAADSPEEKSPRQHAYAAFFWEHIASWVPFFASKVSRSTNGFFSRWAELLVQATIQVAERLTPPPREPSHYLGLPFLQDPRTQGAEAWLEGLVAPATTGVFLTRSDVFTLARSLGLGRRMGERRYMLKALLSQDAAAVLGAVADHVARERKLLLDTHNVFAATRDHLVERAIFSEDLLRQLANEPALHTPGS